MYPDRYDVNKKYPVVLFLHGAGERGNDNEAQLKWGGTLFSDSTNRTKFPAFVIFPQCANEDFWANMSMDNSKKDSLGVYVYHSNRPFNPSLGLVSKLIDSFAQNTTGRYPEYMSADFQWVVWEHLNYSGESQSFLPLRLLFAVAEIPGR